MDGHLSHYKPLAFDRFGPITISRRQFGDCLRYFSPADSHLQRDGGFHLIKLHPRGDIRRPSSRGQPDIGDQIMSGTIINLIIQIIAGAIGGNVAGGAAKNIDLGTIGNSIAGAVGGGVGGQILSALIPFLANAGSTVDIGALAGQAVGGGVAGAIVTAIVGAIKNRTA